MTSKGDDDLQASTTEGFKVGEKKTVEEYAKLGEWETKADKTSIHPCCDVDLYILYSFVLEDAWCSFLSPSTSLAQLAKYTSLALEPLNMASIE